MTQGTQRVADDNDSPSSVAPTAPNEPPSPPPFPLHFPSPNFPEKIQPYGAMHTSSRDGFRPLESESMASRANSKPALNYDIFRSWNGRENRSRDEEMTYGLCLSPERSPQYYRSNYHSLSPSSKTRAIESGHRELMEMASQMPESCYELSLRDLVEEPMVLERRESEFNLSGDREGSKKKEIRAPVSRNTGRMEDGGLYLKLGFPRSVGTAKKKMKKKNDSVVNMSARVSPKPPAVDREWWKRKSSVSSESESIISSTNSGSTKSSSSSNDYRSRRTSRDPRSGCWSWIFRKHKKRNE